jgi:tRNA-splicing ligase RtcB
MMGFNKRALVSISRRFSSSFDLPVRVKTEGVDILSFARLASIEKAAFEQLVQIAESKAVIGHVAAMPDVHLGKGATVGSVFASTQYIAPNAVGVDIGCGMSASLVKGLYRDAPMAKLKQVQALVKERIPAGFSEHRVARGEMVDVMKRLCKETTSPWLRSALSDKHVRQIGSLGGGNHFLELVSDEQGRVWIMLHSGSRNIGNITAEHHDSVARQMMKKYGLPQTNSMLNFLKIESQEGEHYIQDMHFCQVASYARHQRLSN